MQGSGESTEPASSKFGPTRWSVVIAAGRDESAAGREALETLCRSYWQPIYAFVRRQGYSPCDAEDLTQEFFARLLESRSLAEVEPAKGRFRSFLLASLKHFLINEGERARAVKRGGGRVLIPIDGRLAETLQGPDPVETPEQSFERQWALALLERAVSKLRQECAREGKEERYDKLKWTLRTNRRLIPYGELGAELGLSEAAVKVAVFRLRQRYGQLVREEIAQTVSTPEEVQEEVRALLRALEGNAVSG
jgi:RNA polymerase sigma factor (sigma-70 family)